MINERIPGQRLITQHMLSSAKLFERDQRLRWSSVQDLATFIDLFCLYDEVVVLGRGGQVALKERGSDLLGIVNQTHFVNIEYPYKIGESEISLATGKHLAAFLGENIIGEFQHLLDYAMQPRAASSLEYLEDALETYNAVGIDNEIFASPQRIDLLEQLNREQSRHGQAMFLLRTFLYLAYADVRKIAFTPDTARIPALGVVLDREEQFRGKLLSHMKTAWNDTPGDKDMLQRVSPFSAIVFTRANRDRKRIVPVMEELREQLTPIRKQLRNLEDRLLWQSRNEAIKALQDWNGILKEIEENFGIEPQLVSLKQGINFAEHVGENINNPANFGAWLKSIFDLPVDVATRLVNRQPVVELHRLKRELPGSGRLMDAIQALFDPMPG